MSRMWKEVLGPLAPHVRPLLFCQLGALLHLDNCEIFTFPLNNWGGIWILTLLVYEPTK